MWEALAPRLLQDGSEVLGAAWPKRIPTLGDNMNRWKRMAMVAGTVTMATVVGAGAAWASAGGVALAPPSVCVGPDGNTSCCEVYGSSCGSACKADEGVHWSTVNCDESETQIDVVHERTVSTL